MASFHGTRFPGPMFDQNVLRNNFNMNPIEDRHLGSSFQRPPSTPYGPAHLPDRLMHGNFQNRPQFSNFPEDVTAPGFGNRVPNQAFRMNLPPPNIFRMRPPPSNPAFRRRSLSQPFHINPAPSDQAFHINSAPSNQAFRMNSNPFRLNSPPLRLNSPPPNEPFRMNSSHSNQAFRIRSPPIAPRPRFTGHFELSFQTWNRMPSFEPPEPSFQNRPRTPVQSHQSNVLPLQANKKKKQKTREFRKLKEDATEKPFSCDTCDRAFVTENELKDHLSQHIKCDRENCTFEAHPKIVALHQKIQHDTGYADRINKLQDDAEIKKWREERKRRYPTAENIRKRKAEQAEKEARGEILETKEFGKFKRRKEGREDVANNYNGRRMRSHDHRRFNRRKNFHNHPHSQQLTVNVDSESDSDSDSHITLNKFLGLSVWTSSDHKQADNEKIDVSFSSYTIINTAKNLSESDSDQNNSYPDVSHPDNNLSNGKTDQTSFLINDDKVHDLASPANESICEITANKVASVEPEVVIFEDSDDESPDSVQIIKSVEKFVKNDAVDDSPAIVSIEKPEEKVIKNDIEGFEKAKIQNESNLNSKDGNSNRGVKKEQIDQNGFSNRQDNVFQARKSSLLEKLLADDIRHERNIILQCIRHIVNNNFFGIGSKKK